MANGHMKRSSTPLVTKEMPIKTVTRYHVYSLKCLKLKGLAIPSVGVDLKLLELSDTAGRNVK